jgi:hypothetical protein
MEETDNFVVKKNNMELKICMMMVMVNIKENTS